MIRLAASFVSCCIACGPPVRPPEPRPRAHADPPPDAMPPTPPRWPDGPLGAVARDVAARACGPNVRLAAIDFVLDACPAGDDAVRACARARVHATPASVDVLDAVLATRAAAGLAAAPGDLAPALAASVALAPGTVLSELAVDSGDIVTDPPCDGSASAPGGRVAGSGAPAPEN
jgi:hypothetical protein